MTATRRAVAVLISGRGSNLRALIEAAKAPDYPARIALVVSNRADAEGLRLARDHGIETAVIPSKGKERAAFDAEVDALLRAKGIELVCLAGFMRILTPEFVAGWTGRMINIHPSLLPAFKGVNVHEQAIEAGVRISGCTVHFVIPELDDGPIILQAAVPVPPGATPAQLADLVLEQEHRIYPQALRWLAEDRLQIDGRAVRIRGAAPASGALISPAL
ncbi:MAG TPA: phosphoribosylglycinamide formyltransferase [Ferrovibrio sp.]|uniref:phosphoribosylglycinamide formyltransferase n=1 Tax=Ferrovibrio sp. TaxID=1917215 RepID=UPI002B4B1A9C|nr:phosphoribosylglycinamide formyltransferase [Ferrovibrio sp.]HLT77870.1 phosphoribosylglycinamide formyltransferase [Ferrovibrio sp.]